MKHHLPNLDLAVLCNHVEFDNELQPYSLIEPLHTVIIEPDEVNRLAASNLYLYTQMSDESASGTYTFRIQVRSQDIIIEDNISSAIEITFMDRYFAPHCFEHVFRIDHLVFPQPGVYNFHVVSNHVSLSDLPNSARPAKLRVIRGESGG